MFIFDEYEPKNLYCSIAVAVIGAAGIGAATTAYAASKASDAQTNAANTAANTALSTAKLNSDTTMNMYNTTRGDLSPFRDLGVNASNQLTSQLGSLTTMPTLPTVPQPMTQDQLEQTPGYQFNLTQGLKATQNAAAARGLGVSGAALKGAASYATGLADSTYQNQFNNEQALFGNQQTNFTNQVNQQQNTYNRLKGLVDTGENAAAQTGVLGATAANTSATSNTAGATTAANAQIGAGNAQAAAYNTMGNAVATGANNMAGWYAYNGMYGNQAQPASSGGPIGIFENGGGSAPTWN